MASAGCQWVRGGCIAGKTRSYRLRGICWSWLACDGIGGVIVGKPGSHRYRGQAADQALGGSVARSDGRWLTSAYQAASFG